MLLISKPTRILANHKGLNPWVWCHPANRKVGK